MSRLARGVWLVLGLTTASCNAVLGLDPRDEAVDASPLADGAGADSGLDDASTDDDGTDGTADDASMGATDGVTADAVVAVDGTQPDTLSVQDGSRTDATTLDGSVDTGVSDTFVADSGGPPMLDTGGPAMPDTAAPADTGVLVPADTGPCDGGTVNPCGGCNKLTLYGQACRCGGTYECNGTTAVTCVGGLSCKFDQQCCDDGFSPPYCAPSGQICIAF